MYVFQHLVQRSFQQGNTARLTIAVRQHHETHQCRPLIFSGKRKLSPQLHCCRWQKRIAPMGSLWRS